MPVIRRNIWRIVAVCLAVCSSVALSLGYTFAAGVQVDASDEVLAQNGDPPTLMINDTDDQQRCIYQPHQ
jgi:hypothetical protein